MIAFQTRNEAMPCTLRCTDAEAVLIHDALAVVNPDDPRAQRLRDDMMWELGALPALREAAR